jgi:cholest-4-en-3-one 26-monooxygenase
MSVRVDAIDPLDLVDAERYGKRGYPHEVWTRLRAEAPVVRLEPPGWEPFWAVTKHADVQYVAKGPQKFSSAGGITLRRAGAPLPPPTEILVLQDPPKHGPMRRVANPSFTPRGVRARGDDIDAIAIEILDSALEDGDELDFVERIAAPFPLAVVASVLGAPRSDIADLFRWTNEIIGKDDAEYRREGETPGKTIKRARGELHAYLVGLIDQRRTERQDDLVSMLLHADIGGEPLSDLQLLSYAELLVEAGNETTRNAISGGLLALTQHEGEWEKLRANRDLVADAVEEILRWVSPISHFTRIATSDVEVRGVKIPAGEQVAIYFASANRDEDVFEDPFAFCVDRRPNPHLAFGFGEHFCMGAHLARVEIEVMYRHLLERIESFEVTGPIERLSSITNGSLKRLPIRVTRAR